MLHKAFPKAGPQEPLGAEVQPKKVLTPGFTALLQLGGKTHFPGRAAGKAGELVREKLMVRAPTWEVGHLCCWPASFKGDFNQQLCFSGRCLSMGRLLCHPTGNSTVSSREKASEKQPPSLVSVGKRKPWGLLTITERNKELVADIKNRIAGSDGSWHEKHESGVSESIGHGCDYTFPGAGVEGEFWLPWVPRWWWSTALHSKKVLKEAVPPWIVKAVFPLLQSEARERSVNSFTLHQQLAQE